MQKNYTFILLVLTFIFFTGCKNSPDLTTEKSIDKTEKQTDQTLTDYFHPKENEVLISAHRGGSGLKNYPENALETMQYLSEQGLNLFEIDILETKDDQLMLLHDDHLERTTTGVGKVDGKTAEDLRAVNLIDDFGNKTNYKIPYLKDVLKWGKEEGMYFMIDFKSDTSYQNVINLIREEKMENQVALISYSLGQAKKLYQLAPEIMLSVSARNIEELNWILDTDIPTEKMLAFTGTKLSSKELYQTLKEKNIPAILGTLGNLDKRADTKGNQLYTEWRALGVNIFSTDRPLEVYKTFHQ